MRMLVIDNFDSFTWNLVQLFAAEGAEVEVRRNDTPLAQLQALAPDALLVSPGPGTPRDAGVSAEAVSWWMGRIPVLGVCLGMQVINELFGGVTVHAPEPVHGKAQDIRHDGTGLLAGLPSPFRAARYHSLAISRRSGELLENAWASDGTIMGIRHRVLSLHGVQFHPESFMTEHGAEMARRFIALCDGSKTDRETDA